MCVTLTHECNGRCPASLAPNHGVEDYPAPLEQHEAVAAGRTEDNLQRLASGAAYPADQAAPIRTVCPDPAEPRQVSSALLEDKPTTGPILHTRGMHQQPVDQAQCVDQQIPLATLDQLGAIETALPAAAFDCLDGLAVQDGGGGLRVTTSGTAHVGAHGIVQALAGAVLAPPTEVGPGSSPRSQVARDHAPLGAAAGHITDGIEDLAKVGAWASAPVSRRQQRLEDRPLCVGHVGWIRDARHR